MISNNSKDVVCDYLEAIADEICGEEVTPYAGPEDRMRHSLSRLATYFNAHKPATGESLPAVSSPADDGKVLTVVSGKWTAATPST